MSPAMSKARTPESGTPARPRQKRKRPPPDVPSLPHAIGRRQVGGRAGAPHGEWFSALGDRTRLALIARLSRGERCSIAQLTHGSRLTRQAITKHLRVLERAQLVRCVRSGRESLFELDPAPMHAMRDYLDQVSAQWDQALARLQSFVEDRPAPRSRR